MAYFVDNAAYSTGIRSKFDEIAARALKTMTPVARGWTVDKLQHPNHEDESATSIAYQINVGGPWALGLSQQHEIQARFNAEINKNGAETGTQQQVNLAVVRVKSSCSDCGWLLLFADTRSEPSQQHVRFWRAVSASSR